MWHSHCINVATVSLIGSAFLACCKIKRRILLYRQWHHAPHCLPRRHRLRKQYQHVRFLSAALNFQENKRKSFSRCWFAGFFVDDFQVWKRPGEKWGQIAFWHIYQISFPFSLAAMTAMTAMTAMPIPYGIDQIYKNIIWIYTLVK